VSSQYGREGEGGRGGGRTRERVGEVDGLLGVLERRRGLRRGREEGVCKVRVAHALSMRRVQLVRKEGRDLSTLYGREGARGARGARLVVVKVEDPEQLVYLRCPRPGQIPLRAPDGRLQALRRGDLCLNPPHPPQTRRFPEGARGRACL
jgi:hypothetical protein